MQKGSIFNALVEMFDDRNFSDRKDDIETIIYSRYNQGLYTVMNWANEGGDPDFEYIGYDIAQAQHALCNAGRVEGYERRGQTWTLSEATPDDRYATLIDSKEIPAINDNTDELLFEVKKHFGGKYTTHEVDGGDPIKLRIADHSGKHCNNAGFNTISIVIANDNVTEHFRTQSPAGISNEHFFDDNYTAEEIIEEIERLLAEEGVISEAA